jgi:hypothetical protein
MPMMLASRLELEARTIVGAIDDTATQQHAQQVLAETVATLREYEAARPIADCLDDTIRVLERVTVRLDATPRSAIGAALGQIEPRAWVGIIMALATAAGAAGGLEIGSMVMAPVEVAP